MLSQKIKYFLLICIVALFVGCKSEVKVIKVAEKEYTIAEMKRFLEHIWQVKSFDEKKGFYTLPTDGSDIVYELNVTDDLDLNEVQSLVEERFDYFSSLTDLTFRTPKDSNEAVNIFIFLGESIQKIEELPNMKAIKTAVDLPVHDFYKNFVEGVRTNNKSNSYNQSFTGKKTKDSKPYSYINPFVILCDKDCFKHDQDFLATLLSNSIMMALLGDVVGATVSSDLGVQETVLTLNSNKYPYLWELDKLLLDIIYKGEKELSGVLNGHAVRYILDQLIERNGEVQ